MSKTHVAVEYEIVDHGIDHAQYFQGCGTSHTRFDQCFTGCGDTPAEALDDALEQAATSDWNVDIVTEKMPDEPSVYGREEESREAEIEEARDAWIAEQEAAGKVNIEDIHPDDEGDAADTFNPDDFEPEDDDCDECSEMHYYLSVRVRRPETTEEYQLAARILRRDDLSIKVHNLRMRIKHGCMNRKMQKRRLHRMQKELRRLGGTTLNV